VQLSDRHSRGKIQTKEEFIADATSGTHGRAGYLG
jgi:hypothetical protein